MQSFKEFLAEAKRDPNIEYEEISSKGKLDKAIAKLKGADSGTVTKLAKKFHEAQKEIDRLERDKKDAHEKLNEQVLARFDAATDLVVTRVLETAEFTVTLSKQQADKEDKNVIDYENLYTEVLKLVDKSLLPKVDELTIQFTKLVKGSKGPKPSLSVKKIDEATAASNPIAAWLAKATEFAKDLLARYKTWSKEYNVQLKSLIKESKRLGESLQPENAELYVIIGNPGRSQPSALWPSTENPEAMTRAEAEDQADNLNGDKFKITYGALPSSVHWHAKPLSKARDYIIGRNAERGLQQLKKQLSNRTS